MHRLGLGDRRRDSCSSRHRRLDNAWLRLLGYGGDNRLGVLHRAARKRQQAGQRGDAGCEKTVIEMAAAVSSG